MYRVRIILAAVALFVVVTGFGQAPAYGQAQPHTCGNLFFPCQPGDAQTRASPVQPRVVPNQPTRWGMQPAAPAERVVVQTSKRAVTKSTKRRTAKSRVRQRPAAKAVATVAKPAVTKPAVATPAVAKPAVATPAVAKPASEPALSAARSITIAAASIDELARLVKPVPTNEIDPAAKAVAVVDVGEVNEIDLTASPARSVAAVASVGVEESKRRDGAFAVNASIEQLLAIFIGAVAAACVFRVVT